jgi:hypothetical protein
MKTKFTPQYVLEMLQKVKTLSDLNRFNSAKFVTSYPSFYSFRKILTEKGLFQKKLNKEKWIGIEPNLIMAKAIVELYLKRLKEKKQKQDLGLTKEDYRRIVERNKVIEKEDELEELEAPKEEQRAERQTGSNQMKIHTWESVEDLQRELQQVKNDNSSLIRQIGEIQNSFFNGKKVYTEPQDVDAKVIKLREILKLRDTELAKANKKIITQKNEYEALIEKLQVDNDLWHEKEKVIYERGAFIKMQKQEISELIKTVSHQREAIKELKGKGSIKTSTLDQFETVENKTDQTAISILIKDLETSSKLQTEEGEKLLLRINKVLIKNYLEKERTIIIKHLFNFYAELSRQINVPENLISENLTHAELYFDSNFY